MDATATISALTAFLVPKLSFSWVKSFFEQYNDISYLRTRVSDVFL